MYGPILTSPPPVPSSFFQSRPQDHGTKLHFRIDADFDAEIFDLLAVLREAQRRSFSVSRMLRIATSGLRNPKA